MNLELYWPFAGRAHRVHGRCNRTRGTRDADLAEQSHPIRGFAGNKRANEKIDGGASPTALVAKETMYTKLMVLMLMVLGLVGFLILQSQNVFSQANRQNRGDRFRHNGVMEDEDRSVVGDPKSDATERRPVLTT